MNIKDIRDIPPYEIGDVILYGGPNPRTKRYLFKKNDNHDCGVLFNNFQKMYLPSLGDYYDAIGWILAKMREDVKGGEVNYVTYFEQGLDIAKGQGQRDFMGRPIVDKNIVDLLAKNNPLKKGDPNFKKGLELALKELERGGDINQRFSSEEYKPLMEGIQTVANLYEVYDSQIFELGRN